MKLVVELIVPDDEVREDGRSVEDATSDLASAFDVGLQNHHWKRWWDWQGEDGVRVFAVPDHAESVADRAEAGQL